jgi:rod shape-determining protein MreC
MKYLPNKKNKKYYIWGTTLLVTILLGFTIYSIKTDRNLTFIEKSIKDIVLTIEKGINKPINYLKDKWVNDNQDRADNLEEQAVLSYENEIEQYKARIKEIEKENEELKNLTKINSSLSEYDEINATIIYRDMGYWLDTLTIDKGSTSGIEKNMAVVSSDGLIGYVSSVSNFTSTIKLLTNYKMNNKISVKVEISNGKYSYGLLTGYDKDEGVYLIEGISDYVDIPMNAIVTTTGLGEKFPSGIVVGKVKSITTDSFDLAKVAKVKPSADMDGVLFVKVLSRKAISE